MMIPLNTDFKKMKAGIHMPETHTPAPGASEFAESYVNELCLSAGDPCEAASRLLDTYASAFGGRESLKESVLAYVEAGHPFNRFSGMPDAVYTPDGGINYKFIYETVKSC